MGKVARGDNRDALVAFHNQVLEQFAVKQMVARGEMTIAQRQNFDFGQMLGQIKQGNGGAVVERWVADKLNGQLAAARVRDFGRQVGCPRPSFFGGNVAELLEVGVEVRVSVDRKRIREKAAVGRNYDNDLRLAQIQLLLQCVESLLGFCGRGNFVLADGRNQNGRMRSNGGKAEHKLGFRG